MTELRTELTDLRDEMARKGVQSEHDAEEYKPAAAEDDVGWVDAQAQINQWVSYFVIIYLCHLISSHLISSCGRTVLRWHCQVDQEPVVQRIESIERAQGRYKSQPGEPPLEIQRKRQHQENTAYGPLRDSYKELQKVLEKELARNKELTRKQKVAKVMKDVEDVMAEVEEKGRELFGR